MKSHATNSVTINGSAADYRRGEYFQELVGVVNSATSVWQTVSVTNSGGGSTTGSVFVAKTPELFYYDKDGNLTNDGRWLYTWDAENRLVNMTSTNTPPPGSKLKLDFVYDWQGRRIQKLVSTNNGSIYVAQYTNRFVYDGWNLLAILAPNASVLSSFVWGLDLSGSLQGAGGVGGLLVMNDTANGVHFSAYDGNGNLAALVKASDGTVSGNWEYGPFGEVLRQSGLMAKANPFRFSTKYQDDESDNLYYGYRSYNPSTGRWLSRDPMEEPGGVNIYEFAENDSVNCTDWLGFWTIERKRKNRAMAYADRGDTIRSLSIKVGLNVREWKKWLRPEEVYSRGYNEDTPLTQCDSFSVPNKAYVDVSAYTLNPAIRVWLFGYRTGLVNNWVEQGLNVTYSYYSVSKALLLAHWKDPDIYKYAYMGHGAAGNLTAIDGRNDVLEPDKYVPFGINEMQLIACETESRDFIWARNVSGRGLLVTVHGDLTTLTHDLRYSNGQP